MHSGPHRYSESATHHYMHPPNPPRRYRVIIAAADPIFRYTLRAVVQQICERSRPPVASKLGAEPAPLIGSTKEGHVRRG
jgi:hypothetical protein